MDFNTMDGLNTDIKDFGTPCPGNGKGLYFMDRYDVVDVQTVNMSSKIERPDFSYSYIWVRQVKIPDDARIYVEKGQYKADKFILLPRRINKFENVNEIISYIDINH
jgi:hypothetical protein